MAEFTVHPQRHDPYQNFKFRLKWDGHHIAGISHCSGLRRVTEVIHYRESGDTGPSRKLAGRTEFDAITLERGVTHDPAFDAWANQVWHRGATAPLNDFRKDIILELYHEAGHLVVAWKIHRCWVSEYQALADLDANANAVAIERIKIENEGWERDASVTELAEPTF